MSDPLSVAASIAGVATAGFAIAKGLYRISDGIGSSGAELRIYGDEIAAVSKILSHLRSEVLGHKGASGEVRDLLEDTVHACDRTLSPVKAILATLSPILERLEGGTRRLTRFGLRVQWIFKYKEKLLFHRGALGAQQRLLQTLMDLLILQAAKETASHNTSILHLSLQHSVELASRALHGNAQQGLPNFGSTQVNAPQLTEGVNDDSHSLPKPDADCSLSTVANVAHSILLNYKEGVSDAPVLAGNPADTTPEEVDEIESMMRQIDEDLDGRTITAIIHDMRILAPRVLQLVTRELKSHDLVQVFDTEWERQALKTQPLAHKRPSRYQKIIVLLLHWYSDDLFVLPELEDLEQCFREDYGFQTDTYAIPSEDPHLELMSKMVSFIKQHKSRDVLLVIYYGGHGFISPSRQSVWKATRGDNSPELNFSAILTVLTRAKNDILILLDTSAGAASADFPDGNNLVETISASALDTQAADPGRYSFTNALIEVLQEWKKRRFSAALLHAEILARLKHPRPVMLNGKAFQPRSTPVYFVQTSDFSAPSIEICSLGPNGISDPTKHTEYQEPSKDHSPYYTLRHRG